MQPVRAIGLAVCLLATASSSWAAHGKRHPRHSGHIVTHHRAPAHTSHVHAVKTVTVEPPAAGSFDLAHFDRSADSCRGKGRLQDKQLCGSKTIDVIVGQGAAAIPRLIASLTDARPVRPIYDQWKEMAVGDLAYFILDDLFTEPAEALTGRILEGCLAQTDACWHDFLRKHGRQYVQEQWLRAWAANKDRIFWDENGRCFRVGAPEARAAGIVRADYSPHRRHATARRHRR